LQWRGTRYVTGGSVCRFWDLPVLGLPVLRSAGFVICRFLDLPVLSLPVLGLPVLSLRVKNSLNQALSRPGTNNNNSVYMY